MRQILFTWPKKYLRSKSQSFTSSLSIHLQTAHIQLCLYSGSSSHAHYPKGKEMNEK